MKNKILDQHQEAWNLIMTRTAKLDKKKRDKAVNILNGKVSKIIKSFDNTTKKPADHDRNGNSIIFQKHLKLQEKKLAKDLRLARQKATAMLS